MAQTSQENRMIATTGAFQVTERVALNQLCFTSGKTMPTIHRQRLVCPCSRVIYGKLCKLNARDRLRCSLANNAERHGSVILDCILARGECPNQESHYAEAHHWTYWRNSPQFSHGFEYVCWQCRDKLL